MILIILFILVGIIRKPSNDRLKDFSGGWTVTYRGQDYQGVNLNDFRLPDGVKKGELIALKNDLPAGLADGQALIFPLQLSTISVDVNGSVIYGYGSSEYAAGEMVGSAVHIIRIPDESQGKPISIVIKAGENGAFSYIPGIMLDSTSWGFIDYLNYNIYPVVTSIFLVMGGVIIIIISAFIAFRRRDWVRVNQTGMLFFTIGCWNLCEINAMQLFSMYYRWNTVIRYSFGLLSILPTLSIISSAHFDKKPKDKLIQKLVFNFNQICIITAIVLSMLGKIHICNAKYFFEVEGMFSLAIVAFTEWKDYRRKDGFESAHFREMLVCFLCIIVETFRCSAHQLYNFKDPVLQHSFLLYGTALLVMLMLGSYIFELYASYVQKAEEMALKQIAYTDGLTGLFNRTFCKDRMEELDSSDRDYYMISFDVDGLKKINDSKGHMEGDKLLTAFADILLDCFADMGDVIRPGGDEFLVISDDAGRQELLGRLGWLNSMEKDAERTLGFPVKAAYGLAGRSEVSGHTTEEVYYLADQRMYEMKMKGKQS